MINRSNNLCIATTVSLSEALKGTSFFARNQIMVSLEIKQDLLDLSVKQSLNPQKQICDFVFFMLADSDFFLHKPEVGRCKWKKQLDKWKKYFD